MQNNDRDVLQEAITNVLTPDDSPGQNDVFEPVKNLRDASFDVDESTTTLTIFNRWGEVIHVADAPPFEWRGTDANARTVPQATYYFVLKTGTGKPFAGSVTVLR